MGLLLAALLYALAWYWRRIEHGGRGRRALWRHAGGRRRQRAGGGRLFGAQRRVLVAQGHQSADARFASSLALSAIWTVLASAFIGVGLVRDFAPLRYLAMALFGLTVLKVFLVDLSSLGGIYRILGFIGVGVVLLAVSFLYQRGRRKGA